MRLVDREQANNKSEKSSIYRWVDADNLDHKWTLIDYAFHYQIESAKTQPPIETQDVHSFAAEYLSNNE